MEGRVREKGVATALRVAVYRFPTVLRQRAVGYLAIAVLLGLIGGVALGTIAGARRTQSSFSDYLASTNPWDLVVFTAFDNPALGFSTGFDPTVVHRIGELAYVRGQEPVVGFDGTLDYVKGAHLDIGPGEKPPVFEAPLSGAYTTVDRMTLIKGRPWNPASLHEAVMDAQAAKELGIGVGARLTIGIYSDAQAISADAAHLRPATIVRVRIVGMDAFSQNVVEDTYDSLGSALVLFSPAIGRHIASCCSYYSYSLLKLSGGARHLAGVERELSRLLPRLVPATGFGTPGPTVAAADRAIRPISVALAVFGAIAAIAALIIVSQLVGRQLRMQKDDSASLRALGASPAMIIADGSLGILGAVVAGAVLAIGAAALLSPLFPLGPVRAVYAPGVSFDWLVLGVGFAGFALVLWAETLLAAYLDTKRTADATRDGVSIRPPRFGRAVERLNVSATTSTGVRFALSRAGTREAIPIRSAITGGVLAIAVVVATVTFGASLTNLVRKPSLYGWNWNYALLSGFSGDEDLPAHETATLLAKDHDVVAASGVYFAGVVINGNLHVPALGATPGAKVGPRLLSGHALQAPNQIVVGASTLAELHDHLGSTVSVSAGGQTERLVIVGTATMPAIMDLEMGIGAVVDYRLIPPSARNAQQSTVPGPNAFLIRTRGGLSRAAFVSLARVSREVNATQSDQPSGGVVSALRPIEIVDASSLEETPIILGTALSAGALVALALTLVATVRRRRREFAILKSIGFARRGISGIVAWQSTVSVIVGVAIGVPLGIVIGRDLWAAFAGEIHAVSVPTVPVVVLVLVALGAVVLANVVALVPGRIAARTRVSVLLRAE